MQSADVHSEGGKGSGQGIGSVSLPRVHSKQTMVRKSFKKCQKWSAFGQLKILIFIVFGHKRRVPFFLLKISKTCTEKLLPIRLLSLSSHAFLFFLSFRFRLSNYVTFQTKANQLSLRWGVCVPEVCATEDILDNVGLFTGKCRSCLLTRVR